MVKDSTPKFRDFRPERDLRRTVFLYFSEFGEEDSMAGRHPF